MNRFVLKSTFIKSIYIYIYQFSTNIFIKISCQNYAMETVSLYIYFLYGGSTILHSPHHHIYMMSLYYNHLMIFQYIEFYKKGPYWSLYIWL